MPRSVRFRPAARPEEYDAATRATLEHIDRQAVRTVADHPERTRDGNAQGWGELDVLMKAEQHVAAPGTTAA